MLKLAIIANTCHDPAALFRVFGTTHGRKADESRIPVGKAEHFLSTLSELQGKSSDPRAALRLSDAELGHYSVSIGVATLAMWAPSMALRCVYVHFLFGDPDGLGQIAAVVTGTLREWRDEIRNALADDETCPIRRKFATEAYHALKSEGFGDIFGRHTASVRRDGTLELTAN